MTEIIIEAVIDSLKLLPFLYIVYLLMEFVEHKTSKKTTNLIKKSGRFGPIIGGLLGAFPQCGFSVMASNFYVARIISLGTLISIYLSTSDEMIPVLLTNGTPLDKIGIILIIKVLIGMIVGLLIDVVYRKKKTQKLNISQICDEEHCHCDDNIWFSSLKHTVSVFFFILVVNLVMNTLLFIVGEDTISNLLVRNNFVGPLLSGLVGLIPNCASSVIITELFVNNTITFGSALAGLLASSGVALLVLFKINHNYKENIKILMLTYSISVVIGIIFNIII